MATGAVSIQDWLFDEFSSHLANVLEMMAGERPAIRKESSAAPGDPSALRWRQAFSGVSGAVWIAATEPQWTAAGGYLLRAAGVDESDASSLKSTYLETISQALSGLAQAMAAHLRKEITCGLGEETADPAGETDWAVIHFQLGEMNVNLALGLDTALADALMEGQAPEPLSEAEAPSPLAIERLPAQPKTFDLLLDVELPVSVSFGRAQVPLKQVLKLTTGSIVELNRSISEPVEVIVNNCVIARGEVVIVEGNFGVRIQHVISRQERLRTLN